MFFLINIIRCSNQLDFDLQSPDRENFIRYWSNATQWSNQMLPIDGSDVYISHISGIY